MVEKLNTHFYDGKIGELFRNYVDEQNKKTNILSTNWNSKEILNEIICAIDHCDKQLSFKNSVKSMLNLLTIDISGNRDNTNKIDALEILFRTWFCVKNDNDAKISLFEQVAEIKNGTCPQGRTTRIFQIFSSYFPIK